MERSAKNNLSWLSGRLHGLTPSPVRTDVEHAMEEASLFFIREVDAGQFKGQLYRKRK